MNVSLLALLLAANGASLEVRVPGPAGSLAGTLRLPAGRGPFPAVVTLTGSGAHYRDGNRTPQHPYRPFRNIAESLAKCGVASLRLDDRGVGGSGGDADTATAEDTAADARAALRFLRARPDIDPRRIALIGHSYGGQIAPMVAADDPSVAAVVLLGGPARTFRETMRYQHRYRIENDPRIAPADREATLAEAMRQQERNVAASTEAWRRSIQDRDPAPHGPAPAHAVLILQGLTDRAVDRGREAARARDPGGRPIPRSSFASSPRHNPHSSTTRSARREGTTSFQRRTSRRRSWRGYARGWSEPAQ